jgi:hypothetical protein
VEEGRVNAYISLHIKRGMGIWKLMGLRREIGRAICPLRREIEN